MKADPRTRSRDLYLVAQRGIGLVICASLGALYVAQRTEVHTFDALSYTWALEAKPFGLLFHPHHLLYGPVGWLTYHLALALGYGGRADLPVQVLNGVAGAAGVFFLWRFGTQIIGRSFVALGVALLVGLSYAYWVYAAEVEVYTLATAMIVLALWSMARLEERPAAGWSMAVGLAHAGAILFHQTNVLLGLAIATWMLTQRDLRRRGILLAYCLAVALPVALAYGYVAYASRFPGWSAFYRWFTDYAQSGQWGGFLSLEHFPALRSGLQTAVSTDARLAAAFYALVVIGIGVGVYRARSSPLHRKWALFAAVWLFTYLPFFWWWEPWNSEFWIALLPLWFLWILLAWPSAGAKSQLSPNRPLVSWIWPAIYASIPFMLAFSLLRAHYGRIEQMGDPNDDYYREVTDALAAVVQPEELVVTRGNILDLYVPYYAGHPHILSMRLLDQENGSDRDRIMGELIGRLDWAWVTGQPFLIDQFILDVARDPTSNPFGLTPEEIARLRDRYPLHALAFRGEQPLFYGTPRYENLGRTEWVFSETLGGWSAWGIESPRFEQDGWCFLAGEDPQLKGPVINLQGDAWVDLALDITIDVDSTYAQLFWRAPDGEYSLSESLEIPLREGRHVYVTPLGAEPSWAGTIAQIRIDPIPGREEGQPQTKACVHRIEFTRSGS